MKKISFCLMAIALTSATFFSSCKDDDEESSSISTMTTTDGFSARAYAIESDGSDANNDSFLSKVFNGGTTIYSTNTDTKETVLISYKGITAATYTTNATADVQNALIDMLFNGTSVTESLSESFNISVQACIVYKDSEGTRWVSKKATIVVSGQTSAGILSLISGTFTGTLLNSSKAEKSISGEFNNVVGW